MNASHAPGHYPDPYSPEPSVGNRPDPLAELELRWERLARTLHDLRTENNALRGELQAHENHLEQVERELADRMEEIAQLHEEKNGVEARINGLLARYEEIG
ncbi:MAG: cell division protein ZapB [Magnetococcales bacterium]|nr:cell division protein ZapB [Magnetococcales bacterium]